MFLCFHCLPVSSSADLSLCFQNCTIAAAQSIQEWPVHNSIFSPVEEERFVIGLVTLRNPTVPFALAKPTKASSATNISSINEIDYSCPIWADSWEAQGTWQILAWGSLLTHWEQWIHISFTNNQQQHTTMPMCPTTGRHTYPYHIQHFPTT